MVAHLLDLRERAFVLWRPRHTDQPPRLVIGRFRAGNPPELADRRIRDLAPLAGHPDVWLVEAAACGLADGQAYHYWFEVSDSRPGHAGERLLVTDPCALTVDWRLLAGDDHGPAAVAKYRLGRLVECDPGGGEPGPVAPIHADTAPANNHLVVYELPTAWARINPHGDPQLAVGTFRDVLALVDASAGGANFAGTRALAPGRSHLDALGVNALELLPIADSFVEREWGYATSNYFAPDYDLGFPEGHASPTPGADLAALVRACHAHGIRFIIDVVMAFGTRAPLEHVNFDEFHVDPAIEPGDPETQQSGNQGTRDGFGGRLWRYGRLVDSYDPLDGARRPLSPARQFMKAHLLRWMTDFAVDGIRMDSINNVANWDFVEEFRTLARQAWRSRGGGDATMLVVGEELSVPIALVTQGRLDGLWNEHFKHLIRAAILGQPADGEPSFESTVRKMIDCRALGFRDGAEAVNYLGSHDVEGFRNERFFDYLRNNGVVFTEERIKLAFACLLTAVGIPMIFAGDEFADQHDLAVTHPPKQRDPVNFDRLDEPFRRHVFEYVARLVRFRVASEALSVNDTDVLHVDTHDGKRVVAWRRGRTGSNEQVVVVANFSDFVTPHAGRPESEYRVHGWPAAPPGRRWREITQERDVPPDWVGREPIFAWEAKVYALVEA